MLKRLWQFVWIFAGIAPAGARAQTNTWVIDTVAGRDRPVTEGTAAAKASVNQPGGVVVDGRGNVIFSDSGNHRVRRISPTGTITTLAGTGEGGYSGDGGAASAATLMRPEGLALDTNGNLYIADYAANVVRKVQPDGMITTWAGTGVSGNSGNGGRATAATLAGPWSLAMDPKGNLFIGEDLNSTIRKVTPAGTISLLSETKFSYPEGLAADSTGNVYVATYPASRIFKVTSSGLVSTFAGTGRLGFSGDGALATASELARPTGLAIDPSGNLWLADTINNRLRKISPEGNIETIVGSGNIGLTQFGTDPLKVSLYVPTAVATDARGYIYWTETGNNRICVYNPGNRQITTLAGVPLPPDTAGGPLSQALFNPFSSASDEAGNLYIADTSNHVVRKISPEGTVSIIAGTGQAGFNGEAGPATEITLSSPQGVAVDPDGIVFIADTGNGRVRKVMPSGFLATVMGGGTLAPVSHAEGTKIFLVAPTGVAAIRYGSFVVVDQRLEIALIGDASGHVGIYSTTEVYGLTSPAGIAVAGSFLTQITVWAADTFRNRIVRFGFPETVIAGTGTLGYTGDGGPASRATFSQPGGIAADASGNVYIADTGNHVIRMIDPAGTISTIAGTGRAGFSGDKGPAALAQLSFPTGVALDSAGNLLVTDSNNQRIRKLRYIQIPADFALGSDAPSPVANRGSTVVVPLTLTSIAGFTGPVSLAVNPPEGITVQFSPGTAFSMRAGQKSAISVAIRLPATMAAGTVTLTFGTTSGTVTHNTQVTITVTDSPLVTSSGIVNAGSYSGGGVAPGEIVAVYGQDLGPANLAPGSFDASNVLSSTVGGTQVLFDGVPAPLVYVTAGQLSAIVPYSVAGRSATEVLVKVAGKTSAAVAVPVTDAVPGIFNLPGVTQAASLNADLSLNNARQPAEKGSIVVLFATGEGQTSPGGVDGKIAMEVFPKPVLPVTVTIGGVDAEVAYYGAAPFQVAGVMQLNVKVPTSVTSGDVPVVLKVGTKTSQAQSTIRVK